MSTKIIPPISERILIAIDGSTPSEWAVQKGRQLAEQLHGKVRLVYVVEPALPMSEDFTDADKIAIRRSQRGTELLKQTRIAFPPRLKTDGILRSGMASNEITSEAREWNATLIVVGTHGRDGLSNLVLGSTAEAVLRRSPCPVIVVGHEPGNIRGEIDLGAGEIEAQVVPQTKALHVH